MLARIYAGKQTKKGAGRGALNGAVAAAVFGGETLSWNVVNGAFSIEPDSLNKIYISFLNEQ